MKIPQKNQPMLLIYSSSIAIVFVFGFLFLLSAYRKQEKTIALSMTQVESLSPSPSTPCPGKFAFGYTWYKSIDLYITDAWCDTPLSVPDEAGMLVDSWVDCDFSWSPDGNELLYTYDNYGAGHGEIRLFNTQTQTVRTLIPSGKMLDVATGQAFFFNSEYPIWSSDGTQILFRSMEAVPATDLEPGVSPFTYNDFLMDSDGANIRSLGAEEAATLRAEWSAQETTISGTQPLFNYIAGGKSGYTGGTTTFTCSPVWHP